MTISASPCRTYIMYHHALFAQGVRSVLEAQDGVQIVGMEKDIGKALKAVRSIRPEVIILEEPSANKAQWPFLQLATTGRVVTLSLDHAFATVYDQHRIPVADPVDLARAIRGTGKRKQLPVPAPDPQKANAAIGVRPDTARDGDKDQGGRGSSVGRTRKAGSQQTVTNARTTRARKGGRKGKATTAPFIHGI